MNRECVQIVLKHSVISGRVPDTSDIKPGELALNAYDEALYGVNSISGEVVKLNLKFDEFREKVLELFTNKLNSEEGKDLSSNDLTDELYKKLRLIQSGAQKNQPLTARRDVTNLEYVLSAKGMSAHIESGDHDDRYFTREEVDNKIQDVLSVKAEFIPTVISFEFEDDNVYIRSSTGNRVLLPLATDTTAGMLSTKDYIKLMCIPEGAGKNLPILLDYNKPEVASMVAAIAMVNHVNSDDHDDRYHTKREFDDLIEEHNSFEYERGYEDVMVRQPKIFSPMYNVTETTVSPLLVADGYVSLDSSNRAFRHFQIKETGADWEDRVYDYKTNADENLVNINLQKDTAYVWRCRDASVLGNFSLWSLEGEFVTTKEDVNSFEPDIFIEGEPDSVRESPKLSSTPFRSRVEYDDYGDVKDTQYTHESSDWRIRDDSSVVWESLDDTVNLTGITVPPSVLQQSSIYTVEVRHKDSGGVFSTWYSKEIMTVDDFIGSLIIGEPYGGGYFSGTIESDAGETFVLIVASKQQGGDVELPIVDSETQVRSIESFLASLSINGYNDWKLPSFEETLALYRTFKPSMEPNDVMSGYFTVTNPKRTTAESFVADQPESFSLGDYWMEDGRAFDFNNGLITQPDETEVNNVRAVRLIKLL